MASTLRVVAAAPLSEQNARLIVEREPRVDLVFEPSLLPPMRHPADFSGEPSFSRSSEQTADFARLVDSADALYGIPDVDPGQLARTVNENPGLRWVHTMAAGGGEQVRAAGLSRAVFERVTFTTSAGIHAEPLAEFAVFGVLAGAKNLPRLLEQQREREWSGRWLMGQISDMTVLVLGLGGIGRAVSRKLSALGANVVGTSRKGIECDGVTDVIPMRDIPARALEFDAVVAALPGTQATTGLVDGNFLRRLARGVTIVNVGRGSVIDETALVAALDDGHVGLAALDVFESEPLSQESPLWALPNALISPHTAGLTASEDRRIAELFADNATRFLDNRPMRNLVDTVEFY